MSRRRGLVAVVVVGLVLLHFGLHLSLGIGREAPDFVTLAVLLAARELRMGASAGLGLVLGAMEDALSLLSFGANAVALSVTGALGAASRELFVGDSLVFLALYLTVGTWVRNAVHWMAAGEAARGSLLHAVAVEAPLAALYTAAAGLVLLWVLRGLRE